MLCDFLAAGKTTLAGRMEAAKRALRLSVDVLDFGFWQRALRDEVRALAEGVGARSRLYWLRCPDELALRRCRERNGVPVLSWFLPRASPK